MDLNTKSDAQILSDLKVLRENEKDNTANILVYLCEVKTRKLDLARGYSSMYNFCNREMGYTRDEAYSRFCAVNCLLLYPAIETDLRAGRVGVTTLRLAHVVFNRENKARKKAGVAKLPAEDKIAALKQLANESTRSADRILAELFPRAEADQERTEPISGERTLITFGASESLLSKLNTIQNYFAHQNYDRNWERTFELMADEVCAMIEKQRSGTKRQAVRGKVAEAESKETTDSIKPVSAAATSGCETIKSRMISAAPPTDGKNSRYWTARHKQLVDERSEYRCEYVDVETGRRCESEHALEQDEIRPIAFGGTNDIGNLRYLCRAHNGFTAWKLGIGWKEAGKRN